MIKHFISHSFWVCLQVIVCLVVGSFIWLFFNNIRTVSGETEYILVLTPTTRGEIIRLMDEDSTHVSLRSTLFLRIDGRLMMVDSVQPGRYAVEPNGSDFAFWRTLRGHRQTPVQLTFNNIRTIDQLAGRLAHQLQPDSLSFLRLLKDSAVLAQYQVDTLNAMTLFLPNTYEVYWTTTPRDLLARMAKESASFWTATRQKEAARLGLTPQQAYTLASIVESETNRWDEMPRIAGLYLNRLHEDMPLQSDPTVKFATGQFDAKRINSEMTAVASPYNTYRNKGLTPGPIRMATQQGIDAVLHAEKHHYLYMCARETFDGHHNFATTYAEHQKNAQRYQEELNKRNIH